MPAFLEKKLQMQYPNNPNAVYGTMNKIGVMRGNLETTKGKLMEKKHSMEQIMRNKRSQIEAMRNSMIKPTAPAKPVLNIQKPERPLKPEINIPKPARPVRPF